MRCGATCMVGLAVGWALAGCEVCHDTQVRLSTWGPLGVASDGERAMVAVTGNRVDGPRVVALSTIGADGVVSPAGELPSETAWHWEVAGTATTAWLGREGAGHAVLLASYDGREAPRTFTIVDVVRADRGDAITATFDGTRYQVFWETERQVFRRSLAEDGTLGPIRLVLELDGGAELSALSDGAGTTFLRVSYAPHETALWAIDTVNPGTRRIWVTPELPCTLPTTDLWLAGELRIAGCTMSGGAIVERYVVAIDPDSGEARMDLLPAALWDLRLLRARGASMLAITGQDIFALAPDYTVTGRFGGRRPEQPVLPAALGDGIVEAEYADGSVWARGVGDGGVERWRNQVAAASELTTVEVCQSAGHE